MLLFGTPDLHKTQLIVIVLLEKLNFRNKEPKTDGVVYEHIEREREDVMMHVAVVVEMLRRCMAERGLDLGV